MFPFTFNHILVLIGALLISLLITPIFRLVAFKIGTVDNPNARRINKIPMPSGGGIAIFISFMIVTLVFMPKVTPDLSKEQISYFSYIFPVVMGSLMVTVTGFIDDLFEIAPRVKMLGIIFGASIIWAFK